MTREEAQKYAEDMTYRDAVFNLLKAKSIPYRKATLIKIHELLKELEQKPKMGYWINNKCDKCGASRPPLFDNYCPNCGQPKMLEVENK